MLSTWLNVGGILLKKDIFSEFARKISNVFSPSWSFYLPYLRNGWSSWCEIKKEMSRLDAMLTSVPLTLTFDIWPWIFKVKLYLGNWRPDCHGTKGMGVDRMPWCEILMPWSHIILPPYGHRMVLRSRVYKTWFIKNLKVLRPTVVVVTNVMVTARWSYDSWNQIP